MLIFSGIFSYVFLYLVAALGGFYVSLVTYRILNDAIEGKKVDLTAQLKESFSYFFFFVVSLVIQTVTYYFLMNRVNVAYAVAYDALMEELPQPELPVQQ